VRQRVLYLAFTQSDRSAHMMLPALKIRASMTSPTSIRTNLRQLIKSGAIFPIVVISCIAVAVLVVLGFTLNRVITNHGLMPQPTAMETYACKGFAQPFTLDFRHGMDTVKLHTASLSLDGGLLNGKIDWVALPAGTAPLGFVPPTEITYDDSNSLRVLDLNQTERLCERTH
jgi:hypothetical protein